MLVTFIEKKAQGVALILAALFLAASTFFWQKGEYTVPASTLLIISIFFWMPAFMGLFGLTRALLPRYAIFGLWIALFGCVSGICFAFLGYLTQIFNIDHLQYIQTFSRYPFTSQLLLFASGPLFPLSVIVLGIVFAIKKIIPFWQAILFLSGGLAFPISRITRSQQIAHIADLLFLIACIFIALQFFKMKSR